jgi:hypothetical protein
MTRFPRSWSSQSGSMARHDHRIPVEPPTTQGVRSKRPSLILALAITARRRTQSVCLGSEEDLPGWPIVGREPRPPHRPVTTNGTKS